MTGPQDPRRRHLRIPFRLQIVYGSRKFFSGFCLVLGAFFLYGPIPARVADHNGLRYLLGPWIGPLVGLGICLLFPTNPYRGIRSREQSLYRLDERDPEARRLTELLRSPECRRVAFVAAMKVAAIWCAVLAGAAILFRASLQWDLISPGSFWGYGGGTLFAWLFIRLQATGWALTTWWEEADQTGNR